MVSRGVFADASTMTTETKKLTRSTSDRVIAGVAGGLGRYFGIDPVVIRVAFVVLTFFGGAGVIAYGAAWIMVPTDDPDHPGVGAAGVARRLGIFLGMVVLTGVALIGGFWAAASGGGTTTAIVVIGVGALLVIGGFTGGMRWLILPALALAMSAAAVAAGNIDIRGGSGERIYSPASAADLHPFYRLGIGHLRLDLRNTDLGPGDHHVRLKVGVGQAEVLVPPNVCVSSTAHVAGGATTVFERTTGGTYHDWQQDRHAAPGSPHLTVDADVGFGQVRIEPSPSGEGAQGRACTT
jgi:phage shock protein PspC (stress-responsive transcriptional regulator)